MNKINKINVCCQKVLPLVYDESLSYYEVLCKVIQKLNELIKINNNIRDEVHSDYLAVLEGAKVATEAVASVTAMRDEVLTLKQATEQYAHDVVTVYNQTVEARDTAIAKANIAEQSASTASAKANIAQTSATTATEKANIAVQSAETATQKANIAVQSANTATEKANIATEKADSIVQSANTATEKAELAVQSANTATAKAEIASTSATTATQKAESASTSADTATAKAQEASTSATTASNKADSAKHDADLSSTMAQNARTSAEEARTNADKVLTSMSLVSGTVNYYKSDEIVIMVDEDGMYAYTTPYIRNNVLYINVRLEYTLHGPLTIKLPNLTKKTINFAPVINWATGVMENIDLSNLPHTVFTGGGIPIIDGVQFITACVSSYRSFPTYVVGLQMFSNEKTQIALESGKSITIPYYFTLIQPLVFTDEVTPDPTDYITKLNEETQAREQADTQLQNNINTEKTARENADTQLQNNINTEKTDRENADNQLKGDLDEYLLDSEETIIPGKAEYNMLNPENSIVGTLNMQGVAVENPSFSYLVSDFIEIRKSETYAFSYYHTTYNVRYALYPNRTVLYDNNKTFVGQTTSIDSENDYFTANRIAVSGNTCYLAVTPKADGYIRIQYAGNMERPQIAIAPYYEYLENFSPIPDSVVVAKSVKKKIITREQLSDDINAELDKIPCYPTLLNVKHHNSVCCIGDSLTEGYHTAGDIRENKSYPKFIGQLCSWETENKGMSGITSLGWWNTFKDSVDFTKFDAFIIYLGTNGGLTDTIDSDTISGDYNTFAQTNTGGYCAICAKIRDVNPKAKIYIVKYGDSEVSNITQKIADKYGATVLLFTDKTYYDLTDSKYHTDLTHLNTHGYFCFAHAMALQMEKYISEHLDEYTDLQ